MESSLFILILFFWLPFHTTWPFRSVYMLMNPYPGCPTGTSNSTGPKLNSSIQSLLLLLFSWSFRMVSSFTQWIKLQPGSHFFLQLPHAEFPKLLIYMYIWTLHTHAHTHTLYSYLLNPFTFLLLWSLVHTPILFQPRLWQPLSSLFLDAPNLSLLCHQICPHFTLLEIFQCFPSALSMGEKSSLAYRTFCGGF